MYVHGGLVCAKVFYCCFFLPLKLFAGFVAYICFLIYGENTERGFILIF